MVEPLKPSPFCGANDADLVAAFRKPGREDAARGNAAYPVQPFLLGRMFAVDYLDAMGIQKRLDGLRETHSVLPDVLDFFFEVPFKFHRAEHTTLGGHRTDSGRVRPPVRHINRHISWAGTGDASNRARNCLENQAG